MNKPPSRFQVLPLIPGNGYCCKHFLWWWWYRSNSNNPNAMVELINEFDGIPREVLDAERKIRKNCSLMNISQWVIYSLSQISWNKLLIRKYSSGSKFSYFSYCVELAEECKNVNRRIINEMTNQNSLCLATTMITWHEPTLEFYPQGEKHLEQVRRPHLFCLPHSRHFHVSLREIAAPRVKFLFGCWTHFLQMLDEAGLT